MSSSIAILILQNMFKFHNIDNVVNAPILYHL